MCEDYPNHVGYGHYLVQLKLKVELIYLLRICRLKQKCQCPGLSPGLGLKPGPSPLQTLIQVRPGLGLNRLGLVGSGLEAQPSTSLVAFLTNICHCSISCVECGWECSTIGVVALVHQCYQPFSDFIPPYVKIGLMGDSIYMLWQYKLLSFLAHFPHGQKYIPNLTSEIRSRKQNQVDLQ
jgi:hypothetical protein